MSLVVIVVIVMSLLIFRLGVDVIVVDFVGLRTW